MIFRLVRTAAAVAMAMIISTTAIAETFNERWSPVMRESQARAAEAGMAKPDVRRQARAKVERRVRTRRHHLRSSRGSRHRQWYKGGKKWHYVYSRRSASNIPAGS